VRLRGRRLVPTGIREDQRQCTIINHVLRPDKISVNLNFDLRAEGAFANLGTEARPRSVFSLFSA
jgi:hypothetical protein